MDAAQARTRALSLARAGRHLEAIPYFRTVVTRDPGSWSAHLNLASSLGNGAQQARTLSGLDMIATRSSVERIAMVNESVAETEAAGRLAPGAASRAMALFENGRALETWGFPIDALVRFRAAAALAPGRADIAEVLRRAERELATGTP